MSRMSEKGKWGGGEGVIREGVCIQLPVVTA